MQNQTELRFNGNKACPSVRRVRRAQRARRWFTLMHEVVEQASDWSQGPRAEQISLPLKGRTRLKVRGKNAE